MERCEVCQSQEYVRLLFRLMTGSAVLLEDEKRCRMVRNERCVMCNSRLGEDVTHFLVGSGEFVRDRQVLLDDVCRILGIREWLDEFQDVDEEWKGDIAVGKMGEGCVLQSNGGGGKVRSLLVGWVVAEKEAIIVWLGCWSLSSFSSYPSSSLNTWTQCIAFN